ncbi:helix-turn-helix domain-containing protein [Gemmatimonadota bacterium]
MNDSKSHKYSIHELVQASGVSRRTIHYYVQRNLMAPPEGAGRGHYYLNSHLEQLNKIRELQGQGRLLEEVRAVLEKGDQEASSWIPLPKLDITTRIQITEGVELFVSHGAESPTPSQLRELATAADRILQRRHR